MNICVRTSPGRRGEGKPHVFFVGGRRLVVAAICDSWQEHPYRYYEVACDDGRGFLLRYDTERLTWELAGVYAAKVRSPVWRLPYGFFAAAPKR